MKHAKPKLAVFISSLQAGGAERVVSLLIPEFLKTYDVTLILLQKKIAYSIPNDLSMVVLRDYSRYLGRFLALPLFAWQYRKVCRTLEIDVSLSFLNRPNYIAVLAKLMGLHVRMVISERAMPLLQHRSGLSGWVNRRLIAYLYPKADAVIANSRQNAWTIQKTFNVDHCHTVYNPVMSQVPTVLPKNARFTFVSVGRLDKGKNHHVLIEAMRDLDAQLWIIGEGTLKQVLQRQIDELKLNDKVTLLGYQKDPYAWLSQANAFVFSSLHEGFPNVLLEALSCGVAVISTDCCFGPREILAPKSDTSHQLKSGVEEAEFGLLVPINDAEAMQKAMQKMMDDEMLYEYYRTQALKRASDFAIMPIVEQWRSILEEKNLCAE
jgi:N-acetylgalactosamine-N,N'-diacetylbacillosaminyl-diphospho-undecaprenol 4-alpha-N-acetylgalactosaminyltransferase